MLSGRFDKPLKRLMEYFFVSLTHDLSRGLLNNQLNKIIVSPVRLWHNSFLSTKNEIKHNNFPFNTLTY